MDNRKRKRVIKLNYTLLWRSVLLCFSFFLFLLFLSHNFRFGSGSFRPTRIVPNLSVFSSSISSSIEDLTTHSSKISSYRYGLPLKLTIESRVLFHDHVLVIVSTNRKSPRQHLGEKIDCLYHKLSKRKHTVAYPVLSPVEYDDSRCIIRCPLPPRNYSSAVGLKDQRNDVVGYQWKAATMKNQTVQSWDMVVYEAVYDGEETVAVFVKGLNLRPDRESDPNLFSCRFGSDSGLTVKAITAAQEVIRCPLPQSMKTKSSKSEGVEVTILRGTQQQKLPSIARLYGNNNKGSYKYKLCACTMVWNQAAFIKEWITYHAWLGIQRWFMYDNNSDDGLGEVIEQLNLENYNVTRHVWPWIKSQEAGFSHCVLRARDKCSWVAFFDVDEFHYFLPPKRGGRDSSLGYHGSNSLQAVIENVSLSALSVGEIRTDCHSFGPSGLKKIPVPGVTLGYTCRLQSPERNKSIIRPDAIDDALLNQVHHFRLKKEFTYMNLPQSVAVINHYKYPSLGCFPG